MEEIFWNTISTYNMTTWIPQLIICICGFVLTILIYIKPNKHIKIILKAYLSFCFGWLAIVFFIVNGSNELNKNMTAALFGLIAVLWFIDIFSNKIKFIRNKKYDKAVIVLYLLFLSYPIISLLLQKHFSAICTYLMPCPLTAYAITLLISFSKSVDYKVLFLLVLWALTGLPKIFIFNVPEDIILFISGICALVVFIPMVLQKKDREQFQQHHSPECGNK